MFRIRTACFVVFFFISITSFCQITESKLKVFIDCKNIRCDNNFIRTEITLVDFVLDRIAADVHILITAVRTGNGGNSIQYIFFGRNSYERFSDTLTGFVSPNTTEFERRTEIVTKIKFGLSPFVSQSPFSQYMTIDMKAGNLPLNAESSQPTVDKWNYWIYNIGSDGNYNADQVYKSTQLYSHLSANRTTNKLKVGFSINGGYNNTSYTYEDTGGLTKNIVINSNYSFHHSLIKSISGRWSAGYEADYSNNTFSNNKSRKYFRASVEYAIFPYTEVNNKFFTLSYGLDVRHNKYYDTTIYNELSEVLLGHRTQAYLSLKQKWGTINSSITYSNFFKDWGLNHLTAALNVNVRVTGGLSFYIYSQGGLVKDQLYLVKGAASEEDILIKRRQIASAYNFHTAVGLNFRFGSILNNFVNPRFTHP